MTIVSIRGTHGSGKSSIVKAILNRYPNEPLQECGPQGQKPTKPKTVAYDVTLPSGSLFVVGRYETACGGCDAIHPYSNIWPLIEHGAAHYDHVLFEGALVSCSYGSLGVSCEAFGSDMVYAFLDTPLAKCLERIAARRAARGDTRPLDPKNTTQKFNSIARSLHRIAALNRGRCQTIDHSKATQQVLNLFGVTIRKEPTA